MAIIVLYAAAISDALRSPDVSHEQLITLREHANAVLQQQGDLKSALEQLDQEISRRGGGGGGSGGSGGGGGGGGGEAGGGGYRGGGDANA